MSYMFWPPNLVKFRELLMKDVLHIVSNRCFDVPLALTSPTGGGHSVGTVRSWTKAMEFTLEIVLLFVNEVDFFVSYLCYELKC
jgi:hypothetical protein